MSEDETRGIDFTPLSLEHQRAQARQQVEKLSSGLWRGSVDMPDPCMAARDVLLRFKARSDGVWESRFQQWGRMIDQFLKR